VNTLNKTTVAEQARKQFYHWLGQQGNGFSTHPANAGMFKIPIFQPKQI
jgi:hypothetical protein